MVFEITIGRNESEKKIFEKKALAYIGKGYVKMGEYISLSNKIYLDIAKSHVILVAGKRGSGKSYTLGVIAESISEKEKEDNLNIASLIFDTMGIFWTMKFRNYKDKELLNEWKLESKNVPIEIFSPSGYFEEYNKRGISVDKELKIKVSEISLGEWIELFNLDYTKQEAVLISNVFSSLIEKKKTFGFEDIIKEVKKNLSFSEETKNSVISLFNMAKSWGIFDEKEGTQIKEMVKRGQTTVVDLSMYSSIGQFNIRGLVIGLICKKLFNERMVSRKEEEVYSLQKGLTDFTISSTKDMPLIWIFIDEAHEFLPKEGKTPATDALIQLLREGRQPGISLILATQQPGKIHTDAMTQSDIVISHLLTAEQDIKALNEVMQSYVYEGIKKKMNELPKQKGAALVLDDNSQRIYSIRVRPRYTWHGGETPSAIQKLIK
ncbi:MAG: ATP-binding protein [Candidatus Pacearchaeota archaeon]